MVINFMSLESSEVDSKRLYFDLSDIECTVNDWMQSYDFNGDVDRFDLSVHTYAFNGPFAPFFEPLRNKKGYKKYGIHITKAVDYYEMVSLNNEQQNTAIKNLILGAVNDLKRMQKRLKDFNVDKFYNAMDEALTYYMCLQEELICEEVK
jgi:hypothetical protein